MLTAAFQLVFKDVSCGLVHILGNDNTADINPHFADIVHQAQNVHIVCNTDISPDFVFLNIAGADRKDDLCFIL